MIPSAQKAAFRLRPTIVNADIDPFYIEELSAGKFEVDIVSIGTGCETLCGSTSTAEGMGVLTGGDCVGAKGSLQWTVFSQVNSVMISPLFNTAPP